jgi:broad specificity phosphatase PhoE
MPADLRADRRHNARDMSSVFLVRHGQASFGSANYDQLSPLGEQQCLALGEWMQCRGLAFDAVLTGSLRRHEQSLKHLQSGLKGLPEAEVCTGLDEYDSEALVRAVVDGPLTPATDAESARQHFRWLRQGLLRWMSGTAQPVGMPSWPDFQQGVAQVLARCLQQRPGRVLVVSSGGPIATAIGLVLGLEPAAIVELNLRIRNSSVTELVGNARRHSLLAFNQLPHLDDPQRTGWETYA